MRNRRKEQELKEEIIKLRKEKHRLDAILNQKMIDLYLAMGVSPDHAGKMV